MLLVTLLRGSDTERPTWEQAGRCPRACRGDRTATTRHGDGDGGRTDTDDTDDDDDDDSDNNKSFAIKQITTAMGGIDPLRVGGGDNDLASARLVNPA